MTMVMMMMMMVMVMMMMILDENDDVDDDDDDDDIVKEHSESGMGEFILISLPVSRYTLTRQFGRKHL